MRQYYAKISAFLSVPILVGLFLLAGVTALVPQPAFAGNQCGDVDTAFDFGCPDNTSSESDNIEDNPIYAVILIGINILAAGVGVIVVGYIVWGSILYASADGKADQIKQGVGYIVNALIGLALFLSMYAIINFLVPGGILN